MTHRYANLGQKWHLLRLDEARGFVKAQGYGQMFTVRNVSLRTADVWSMF